MAVNVHNSNSRTVDRRTSAQLVAGVVGSRHGVVTSMAKGGTDRAPRM